MLQYFLWLHACFFWRYGDGVDNTVEENSSVFSPVRMRWLLGHVACNKTLHQQNPPVFNWRCRLMQVDLYNGHKAVVVVLCHTCMLSDSDCEQLLMSFIHSKTIRMSCLLAYLVVWWCLQHNISSAENVAPPPYSAVETVGNHVTVNSHSDSTSGLLTVSGEVTIQTQGLLELFYAVCCLPCTV